MAAVIVLSVLLIGGIVAVMNSIPLSVKKVYGYSQHLTGVTPRGDMSYFPTILDHFKHSPVPIERTLICRTAGFSVNTIVGPWPFVLHGFSQNDFEYVARKLNLGVLDGRLPIPGEGESVITRPVANNLRLRIGSVLLDPKDDKNYSQTTVKIVGIYESDEWFSFTSYEYVALNHFPPVDVVIYFTKDLATQRQLDDWAEKTLKGSKANVYTYAQVEKESDASLRVLFRILNLVIGLLVIVVTLMMCMMVSIHLSQRIVEFGLLQALGFSRKTIATRSLREALWVIGIGWVSGVLVTFLLLSIVKKMLMEPKGFFLDPLDIVAYAYTLPIPIVVTVASSLTVYIRFRNFDPIAVIERRIV